ncbi:DNA methyltransferase [Flavobacteriaceae bacterium]|nr:DNA methyltransferase [Flavobacteriaceae bacterium]
MKTEISPLKLSVHDSIIAMKVNVDHSSMEASLKEFGFKDPIKVVSIEDEYQIWDGYRRWMAAQSLGIKQVPIVVVDTPNVMLESILSNSTQERTAVEIVLSIRCVLDELGSSQGKKRELIDGLEEEDLKDRFTMVSKILGLHQSSVQLRKYISIDNFDKDPSNPLTESLIDKIDLGGLSVSRADNIVKRLTEECKLNNELDIQLKCPIISNEYEIYNMDNKKAYTKIEDNSIDLFYFSPDYLGIKNYRNVPKEDQIGALDLNDYIDELVNQTLHFIKCKLKDTGVCVINIDDVIINNQSQAIPQRVTLKMISGGVKFIQEVKWGKSNPIPLSNFKGFQPSTESILIFAKDEKKFIWNEYRNLNLDDQIILKQAMNKTYVDSPNKRVVDVLNDELVNDFFKTSVFQNSEFKDIDPNYKHQAPQNEQIPLFFILFFTKPGMRVCDLYGGSGTTGAAALKKGRSAVMFDLDPVNIEFMEKRFKMITEGKSKNKVINENIFFD